MNQATLNFDHHPADRGTGLAIGRDYARAGIVPPPEHLHAGDPVRDGWQAGRAMFGDRAPAVSPRGGQWLQLRLGAWLRGRSFELMQVTPNYLRQIDATHCPISRDPLTRDTGHASDAVIDRVFGDAGFAAGNLAVMSRRASAAKDDLAWDDALAHARHLQAHGLASRDGLTATEWMRAAVLVSFVSTLPHDEAARLPLAVLPPNRLRLLNPIQGLQVLICGQLSSADWSHRVARIEALLPGAALRRDFNLFLHSVVARMLEAGRLGAPRHCSGQPVQAQRWALEDAWANEAVQRRWQRFALLLNASQSRRLIERIHAKRLAPQRVLVHDDAQAVDGWALATRGFAQPQSGPREPVAGPINAAPARPARPASSAQARNSSRSAALRPPPNRR